MQKFLLSWLMSTFVDLVILAIHRKAKDSGYELDAEIVTYLISNKKEVLKLCLEELDDI